jgi:small-conductance mechanosensitive channel
MDVDSWDLVKSIWKVLGTSIFEISGQKISILSVSSALLFFYISTLVSKYAEKAMGRLLADRKDIDRGIKDSIQRITRYAVLIIGGFITLDTVGISMSSLAAVGAVLMVGIGFGLQNITQNFISGLIILLERPIKVGDLVEVEGVSGRVSSIGARSTTISTRDDVSIIVPNSQFISEQVINESLSGELLRLKLKVGVAYGSDPRKVEQCLEKAAYSHPNVMKNPNVKVFFSDFGASSLDFTVTVWVSDIWNYHVILSDIRFKIFEVFKEEGIEIPFKQIDIHFDPGQFPQHQ